MDAPSLARAVDLFVKAGVNGVTALGVTGEVARLTEGERGLVLETVINQVKGRAKVIAGTSADGLVTCVEFSRRAKAVGADAVMVSPPRMLRPDSDAIVRFYSALADAVDVPIVVQDYPPISGFSMEPWLLVRIAREVPRVCAIKLEDPPTPEKPSACSRNTGIEASILGGLGGVFLLEELMAGATGTMTGFAIPEALVQIVGRFQSGDAEGAAESSIASFRSCDSSSRKGLAWRFARKS